MVRAPKVCPTRGCPNYTEHGRCEDCRHAADKERGTAAQRGYNSRGHQRFRVAVLRRDLFCQAGGCPRVATVADHHPVSRRDLVARGQDPNDPAHGRGLCKTCHDRSTAVHQPGGWRVA